MTLNLLQAGLLDLAGWEAFDARDYFLHQGWVSHLWFLNNLIIYFSGTAFLWLFIPKSTKRQLRHLFDLMLTFPVIFLLLIPFLSVAILALNSLGFSLYSSFLGIFNTFIIMQYLPFYLFGLVLGLNHRLLKQFSSLNPLLLIVFLTLAIVFHQNLPDLTERMTEVTVAYLVALRVVSGCVAVLPVSALFKYSFQNLAIFIRSFLLNLAVSSYSGHYFWHDFD